MNMRSAAADISPPSTVRRSPPPRVTCATRMSRSSGALVPTGTPTAVKATTEDPGNARVRTSPSAVPTMAASTTMTTRCQSRMRPAAISETHPLQRLLGAGDLAELLLVLLDVLRQGPAQLLGDQRRRDEARQNLDVRPARHDPAEIEDELRAVVGDAAEVDVDPLGDRVVQARAELHLLGWVLHGRSSLVRRRGRRDGHGHST